MELVELLARREFISKGSRVVVRAPNGEYLVGTITFIRKDKVFVDADAGYKLQYSIKSKNIVGEGPKKKYSKSLTTDEAKNLLKESSSKSPEEKESKGRSTKEDKPKESPSSEKKEIPVKEKKKEVPKPEKKASKKEEPLPEKSAPTPSEKKAVKEPSPKKKIEGISPNAKKLSEILSSKPVKKYLEEGNIQTMYYSYPVDKDDPKIINVLVKNYGLKKVFICDHKSKYTYMAKIGKGQVVGIYHYRNKTYVNYFPNSFTDYADKIYPKALDPKKALFRFDENGRYLVPTGSKENPKKKKVTSATNDGLPPDRAVNDFLNIKEGTVFKTAGKFPMFYQVIKRGRNNTAYIRALRTKIVKKGNSDFIEPIINDFDSRFKEIKVRLKEINNDIQVSPEKGECAYPWNNKPALF